jgi:periodic tryptophan protein 1
MVLNFFFRICFSEEDESMDVDSGALPKSKTDDLAEYNLEDYDNDVKDDGALSPLSCIVSCS